MLKRLATAGVLTVAVGGVLMSATPAMAGGHDYGHHKHHKHFYKFDHHKHFHDYDHHFHKYHHHKKFDLDFKSYEKDIDVDNETFALLNCVNLVGGILGTVDQNCFIGNTRGD